MTRLCATIDIGTNTVIVLAARCHEGRATVLLDKARVVGLGVGASPEGGLSEDSMDRCAEAVLQAWSEARSLGVPRENLYVTGTAALRRAPNSHQFQHRLEVHELPLDIVPGELEAQWSALAVSATLPHLPPATIVDIGGGSTEFAPSRGEGKRISVPLGALRLTEECLPSDPPTPQEIHEAQQRVRACFQGLPTANHAVAVGGTATTLQALRCSTFPYRASDIHGSLLRSDEIQQSADTYLPLGREALVALGVSRGRARVLPAGILLLQEACHALGVSELTLCDSGLRHGAMLGRFKLMGFAALFPEKSDSAAPSRTADQ